ncbi:class I SAM-dependent methyltransferase [Streptomyces sp. NPDC058864]
MPRRQDGDRSVPTAENPAPPTPPAQVNDYDSFAESYAAQNETSLQNAGIERPAMLSLAGDVAGRRILDAGCGAGPLLAALRDRGALVTGVDSSAGMLELARRRLGAEADLRVADLGDPLPFADGAFDIVVASLVLHYLEDWGPTLSEMRRVLGPGGKLIASVQHPFVDYVIQDPRPNYFETTDYTDDWAELVGQPAPMRFWRRSLQAMTGSFTAAGFRLAVISEPQVDPAARELYPDEFRNPTLSFMLFALEVPPEPATGSAAS